MDGKETTLNMMIFQKTNNIWKAGSGRRFSEAVPTTCNFIERPFVIVVIKGHLKAFTYELCHCKARIGVSLNQSHHGEGISQHISVAILNAQSYIVNTHGILFS